LSKRTTWKKRYEENSGDFDWLVDGHTTADYVISFMKRPHVAENRALKLMDLGCGSSPFSRILYEKSSIPVDICSIDYAESAVAAAKRNFWESGTKPYSNNSSLSFITADAQNLPFRDNSFEIVVDKGTMDSALKHKKLGYELAQKMAKEVIRVLKVYGHVLQFTDEDPELRLPLWEKLVTEMKLSETDLHRTFQVLDNSKDGDAQNELFMYVIRKTRQCV
jgi:ubiquinone/menaquinone biosynthesis C-methylase UbiE